MVLHGLSVEDFLCADGRGIGLELLKKIYFSILMWNVSAGSGVCMECAWSTCPLSGESVEHLFFTWSIHDSCANHQCFICGNFTRFIARFVQICLLLGMSVERVWNMRGMCGFMHDTSAKLHNFSPRTSKFLDAECAQTVRRACVTAALVTAAQSIHDSQ